MAQHAYATTMMSLGSLAGLQAQARRPELVSYLFFNFLKGWIMFVPIFFKIK
jgi:hypothetical protein